MPKKPDDLKERIAVLEKTTISWRHLVTSLGVIVVVLSLVTTFFYKTLLASQIEAGISNSPRLTAIENQLSQMNSRLDRFVGASPILNPKVLMAVLRDATSGGDPKKLATNLPSVRNILGIVREKKVPLPDKDYQEITQPLFARYQSSDPNLKHELWLTFIEFANARSSTDSVVHPITDAELARAAALGNLFEGKEIDLSSKKDWSDTVFRNCKLKISQPGNDLTLSRVRFLNSEFYSVAEDKTGLNLLKLVIDREGSSISGDVARFSVDRPIGKTNPPS